MSKYEKLTNQPLVVVLAEFRFSSILQMENYIPAFQNFLRQDFPLFSTTEQQEMIIEQQGIRVNSSTGWVFLSSNKKRAIILDRSRLVILSSEYERFPNFWNDCKKALDFLIQEVKPTLLLRVGLRYSDAIIEKNKEEPIESYVQSVVCEAGSMDGVGDQVHRINETIYNWVFASLFRGLQYLLYFKIFLHWRFFMRNYYFTYLVMECKKDCFRKFKR